MNIPQEAVEAAVLAMDGASLCGCSDCQRVTALNILAAAEPHLRKKWADEIIDELDAARATGKVYTYGEVQDLIREGTGE